MPGRMSVRHAAVQVSYSPYGEGSYIVGARALTPYGFEGGYNEPSGLIYLLSRYYDAQTEQFISVGLLVAQTGQPNAYAGSDPVNGSDPTGLCGWDPFCQVAPQRQAISGAVRHKWRATS